MLWMVPMQSWKILGAKYIAAILQIFFISAAYVLAAIACILSLIAKWMHGKSFLKGFALVQSGFSREIWIGSHLWQSFCFLPCMDLCDRNRISGSHCIQNGVDQFQICGHCFIHFVLCDQWNCGIYLQSVCQIRTYGNP